MAFAPPPSGTRMSTSPASGTTTPNAARPPLVQAREIYGFKGALVQARGDGPSTYADFGAPGALMHYSEATKEWQPIEGISPKFQPEGYNPNDRFFDALLKGEAMPVTMHDGRRSVQLLAAAELADREKRLVELVEIV